MDTLTQDSHELNTVLSRIRYERERVAACAECLSNHNEVIFGSYPSGASENVVGGSKLAEAPDGLLAKIYEELDTLGYAVSRLENEVETSCRT